MSSPGGAVLRVVLAGSWAAVALFLVLAWGLGRAFGSEGTEVLLLGVLAGVMAVLVVARPSMLVMTASAGLSLFAAVFVSWRLMGSGSQLELANFVVPASLAGLALLSLLIGVMHIRATARRA